jgi:signal peptidase I
MDKFIKIKTVEDLREAVEHDLLYHCGEPLQTTDYLIAKDLFYGKYEMLNPDYVEPVNLFEFLNNNSITMSIVKKGDIFTLNLDFICLKGSNDSVSDSSYNINHSIDRIIAEIEGQEAENISTEEKILFPEHLTVE